ncbi:MAG: mycothiol synthase [Actinomycetota bacterium]
MSSGAAVQVRGRLNPAEVAEVTDLVDAATAADGVRPLSEHVSLHLRYGGDLPARNLLLREPDGTLAGYAHLDVTDPVEGGSAELVVHPARRGRGHGRALVAAALAQSPPRGLRLWAHGEHPAAARLAATMGFWRSRSLWQMRRSLFAPLPAPRWPEGVTLRTFRPGGDDEAWVALNARSFADHPEQGGWSVADLRRRLGEPWFDPAGFFLAERAGRLVGFHWTKVHGSPATNGGHGHEPIGEVYVVGVLPEEQGHGLGRALTLAGLAHLRQQGLPAAMLYVDADNVPAIRLYADLGFTHWDTDTMFRSGPPPAPGRAG